MASAIWAVEALNKNKFLRGITLGKSRAEITAILSSDLPLVRNDLSFLIPLIYYLTIYFSGLSAFETCQGNLKKENDFFETIKRNFELDNATYNAGLHAIEFSSGAPKARVKILYIFINFSKVFSRPSIPGKSQIRRKKPTISRFGSDILSTNLL